MSTARKAAKKAGGLTDLERRFVAEYLIDLSQSNAYRRAMGGDGEEKSWKELGYKVMQRPHVRAAIDKALEAQLARLDSTAESVRREIERMAMFDPAHVTGVTCPEDIARLPEDVRRAIVGWSWDRQGNFIVKLAKEGALEMLAKHHGLYEADNRQKGTLLVKKSAADMSDEELAQIAAGRKPQEERKLH